MRILGHASVLFMPLALTLLAGCTTYKAATLDENEAILNNNSKNFVAQSGDIKLDTKGNYSVKDTPLVVSQDTINGMPTYDNATIDGTSYTVLSTGNGTGRSLYLLSPNDQFAALGTSDALINNPAELSSTIFAGKFTEMAIENGAMGAQNSGTIVLNFDQNAGALRSVSGPTKPISYEWNSTQGKFIGTENTTGESIATNSKDLLGNYKVEEDSSQTFGTFWAVSE